jgi:hypothetical protein
VSRLASFPPIGGKLVSRLADVLDRCVQAELAWIDRLCVRAIAAIDRLERRWSR